MIYALRKKFIVISAISLVIVISLIYVSNVIMYVFQLNKSIDTLIDAISENNGEFPDIISNDEEPSISDMSYSFGFHLSKNLFLTKEARYKTRFFIVEYDKNGNYISKNTEAIASVNDEKASELAEKALNRHGSRGWISVFRFKKYEDHGQIHILFIDGSTSLYITRSFILTLADIFLISMMIILLIILILSRKAVEPFAENYKKQKQFITNVNHELKTPLTLINANLDIVEMENGENEWLNDIRTETEHMTHLVNELVMLCRMDEEGNELITSQFNITKAAKEVLNEFNPLAEEKKIKLIVDLKTDYIFEGDEKLIKQLFSILLDNAVKYCDDDGEIYFRIEQKKNIVITVKNSFADVTDMELNNLFERFYRSDKARTSGSGFGIGLSIAKTIVDLHKGDIYAYNAGDEYIGFKINLK